ncbi:MAG TPA: ion transporter [Prosthecobacter sp.]
MSSALPDPSPKHERLWRIIFLSDTKIGRAFDLALLWLIGLSVLTIVLESVDEIRAPWARGFWVAEWVFTVLFTLEYLARLVAVRRPLRYAFSFFGILDLISILPAYLELLVPGTHYLMALRVLRLMRIFRILKMAEYLGEANVLLTALKASRRKITLFLCTVLSLVLVEGTVVYVLEHEANPDFANIPQAIYWAIVTITTVGYGDVAPVTVPGKMMASIIMLTGFAIIAVPTGIVTQELGRAFALPKNRRRCAPCGWEEHDQRASYCQHCGARLDEQPG